MIDYKNRIENMLLYLSVGDALGKICSKYNKKQIYEIYGREVTGLIRPIRPKSLRNWERGDVTDDTILTLLVLESLIENNGFNRRDIAKRLIDVDPKGGKQIEFLKKSKNLDYVSTTGNTNGAAIRVSPLSIIYPDLGELTDNVIALSNLTHGSDEAIAAALAVSYALHYYVEDLHSPISMFLLGSLSQYFPHSRHTQFIEKLVEAFTISEQLSAPNLPDRLEHLIGYEKYAWSSVPTGIILGSKSIDPYETLIKIIHRNASGGDLDSVASIAGSLLGLRTLDERVIGMGREIERHNGYSFGICAERLTNLRFRK